MPVRLFLLSASCCTLTSCGTASHLLNQAGGALGSVTSPVLGALRLSDSPDLNAPVPPRHDSRPVEAERPH